MTKQKLHSRDVSIGGLSNRFLISRSTRGENHADNGVSHQETTAVGTGSVQWEPPSETVIDVDRAGSFVGQQQDGADSAGADSAIGRGAAGAQPSNAKNPTTSTAQPVLLTTGMDSVLVGMLGFIY